MNENNLIDDDNINNKQHYLTRILKSKDGQKTYVYKSPISERTYKNKILRKFIHQLLSDNYEYFLENQMSYKEISEIIQEILNDENVENVKYIYIYQVVKRYFEKLKINK